MNARTVAPVILLACGCLLAVACGGSSAGVGDAAAGEEPRDVGALYARIEDALDGAYVDLGKPRVDWDNLEKVKDRAFEKLTSDPAGTPAGSSWSVSVMPDHIAVYANFEGVEKSGQWRP